MTVASVSAPATEADLAARVAEAAASGDALKIRGGGSRSGLGAPVDGDTLETSALDGITLYEPGALTIVVRAGTCLSVIEETLAEERQLLPFEPLRLATLYGHPRADADTSTIGGVVATNASGPRRVMAGACRDSLIGVRFVDGRGRIIKNGGRVMKNVTGYDLVKLMCGTHGTLGVLTEVSFKLLPAPEAAATVLVEGLEVADAVAAMNAALGSPYNVSGVAHVSAPLAAGVDAAVTLVRVEGLDGSVDYRAKELAKMLGRFGSVTIESPYDATAGSREDRWRAVRDIEAIAALDGDVWRLSVKPTDAMRVAEALPDVPLLFDWGGGLVHASLPAGFDLRAAVRGIPGHATLLRASDTHRRELGVFQPEAAPIRAISARLRAEFDPAGVLNPGRMG